MTKTEMIKFLQLQLKRLNVAIDKKIALGQSYKNEAAQHRLLRTKLVNLA